MSGIAALFHRDGRPVELQSIRTMLEAVPYLGLDGMWTRVQDSVGLGYARLAATNDDEHERQPLVSRRTGASIVASVRLDNRDDLLSRLSERPRPNVTDAELILHAYEEWGTEAIVRLLGDFAFAIWDPRYQRLTCARDTGGQRPLFYRLDRETFAASSEIHQLLQDPSVPIAPNGDRIRDYLTPMYVTRAEGDTAATFYGGISALRAGHVLEVERKKVSERRYWSFAAPTELRYSHDADYAEHFRALFGEVVRTRLRTNGPIGALLSGGLDSSSVVCTTQELYRTGVAENRGFTSYSLVFEGLECDESEYVRDTQAKYGFHARFFPGSVFVSNLELAPHGFMRVPGKATTELDPIFGAAADDGIRVLLSGDVGDGCVFGSRHVFDSLLRHGRPIEAWRQMRLYRRLYGDTWRKILLIYTAYPLLPPPLQRELMVRYTRRVVDRERDQLLPWWLPASLCDDLLTRHMAVSLEAERCRRFSSPAREEEYRMLFPPEAGYSTAGFPVQIWRPYADRRLHQFLLAIPPEQKMAPDPQSDELYAASKRIVRRGLAGILPESIRNRKTKTHFASLFEDELRRRWSDYAEAFGPDGRSELASYGLVDAALFWRRLNQVREMGWGGDLIYMMRAVWLETWLRALRLPRERATRVPLRAPLTIGNNSVPMRLSHPDAGAQSSVAASQGR